MSIQLFRPLGCSPLALLFHHPYTSCGLLYKNHLLLMYTLCFLDEISAGMIAVIVAIIVAAIIATVVIIVLLIILWLRKHKNKKQQIRYYYGNYCEDICTYVTRFWKTVASHIKFSVLL